MGAPKRNDPTRLMKGDLSHTGHLVNNEKTVIQIDDTASQMIMLSEKDAARMVIPNAR